MSSLGINPLLTEKTKKIDITLKPGITKDDAWENSPFTSKQVMTDLI